MTRPIFDAIRIKIFLWPTDFGDRKNAKDGDIYTSRNPVWLKKERSLLVSTLIGNRISAVSDENLHAIN
jgi:hypothetical protein